MAYGTVKVDNVTFTYNAADASTTFSGLYASTTNNLTLSGTASANTFTGTTANFTNTNAQNISVTTLLSGLAITGGTAGFTTVTGTTVTGTTANFVTVSGTTVTGGTAGFTTVTGTTVTGTTANFVTLSGTTVTGNIGQFTSLTGATTTMTSGVFALGTEPLPSISFVSDPNTGIYSPGADQVAVATNGVARLQINSSGTLGLAGTAGNSISIDGTASANRFSVDSSSNIGIGIAAAAGTPINIASSTGPAIELGANNGAYFGAVYGTTYTASEHFFLNALAGYHYYEALVTGPNAVPENVFNDDAANLDFRIEGQANANLFFVDASADAVGIGTSSPDVGLHYRGDTPKLRIESSNTLDTTAGTEEIGRIEWEGFRNTNFNAAASIRARQDGTWSTNTTWHSPAALEFYTQNNTGVEVTTPRMIINSSGNVGIGTTSPGKTLDIVETDVVQTPNASSPLVVRRSAGVNINLLCSNAGDGGIVFGDTDNAQPGRIIYSHSTDALQLWANSGERARIDSSGRLLIGTSSALSVFNYRQSGGNLGSLQAVTVGAGANTPTFANFAAATYAQQLSFVKSRGTTIGDYAIVADGDNLGSIYFFGADGVDVSTAGAAIISQVDGTPGANDMPGRLVFSTTADGGSSPTERMRIDSAGRVGIGAAPNAASSLHLAKIITGGTTAFGVLNNNVVQSDVTTDAQYYNATANTAVAAFTLTALRGYYYRQATLGVGSTVTNQYGVFIESDVIGATNNYGLYSNIPSGTNRWNFYANGTADSYFASNNFIWANGGTERARIDSSGRLGLGVSSPTSLLHLADAGNIAVGTTTGTKIGTATTQKLGFYNATPVVQPTAVADATTAVDVITQLNALLAKLRTLGIIAT